MCGIVGYTSKGRSGARAALLEGLARLEYRGYDSAGLALAGDGLVVYRRAGRVKELAKLVPADADAGWGIAHTRWATHGAPTDGNAHPHTDCTKSLAVVHNGILENFAELKEELAAKGHKFRSETDTEVFAHLLEEEIKGRKDGWAAFQAAARRVKGSYALVVAVASDKGVLYGARREAPLVVGYGKDVNLFASDVTALIAHTRDVSYLEDGDVVRITPSAVEIRDAEGRTVERPRVHVEWKLADAQKGGYEHFMLKEIHEEPRALAAVLTGRLHATPPYVRLDWDLTLDQVRRIEKVVVLACGTSHHAGLVGKGLIETLAGIPVACELASEYRYGPQVEEPRALVIGVSQSGETADTLAAVREAKRRGHRVLAVTNVVGSSIARDADAVLYLRAGPEIGVAASKSFISQVGLFTLLALHLAEARGRLAPARVRTLAAELEHAPRLVKHILDASDAVRDVARLVTKARSCFFLGRLLNHPVALEGALKLKEISYVHAEGFSGGELKHGPFALLTDETPVIALFAEDHVKEKMISNIIEVKARGAPVYAIAPEGDLEVPKYADRVIRVPAVDPLLAPIANTVACHLLAYWAARERGCDIDKPRNLAKSVTVE